MSQTPFTPTHGVNVRGVLISQHPARKEPYYDFVHDDNGEMKHLELEVTQAAYLCDLLLCALAKSSPRHFELIADRVPKIRSENIRR